VASVGGSGSAVDHQAISHDLEELDLQLSLILSRDKSTWDFSPLKQRVEKLIETAATPAERGEARFLLDKIKRFEETFDVQPVFEAKSAPITANREVRSYDGEGRLSAVKSADKPVAPYALLDESGKRICFVTPSPGLGISSHLNKRVGVYGKRGIIADLNEPHVLASRVIELDRIR
jgi:hypothetical protein